MIYIFYPPGCYGWYFAQSLYMYSNLKKEEEFAISKTGDSHWFRNTQAKKDYFALRHLDYDGAHNKTSRTNNDPTICIIPNSNHNLDYFNNQFIKQDRGNLIKYILNHIGEQEFLHKLKNQWNYNGSVNDDIPLWILREWFSFWIDKSWKDGYNTKRYVDVDADLKFSVDELFDIDSDIFIQALDAVKLTMTASVKTIQQNIQTFIQAQKYHNSQKRCQQWVDNLLKQKVNIDNPCQTIFDEAYVQKCLREQGIELKCDGLNYFPKNSEQMIKHLDI